MDRIAAPPEEEVHLTEQNGRIAAPSEEEEVHLTEQNGRIAAPPSRKSE